MILRFVTILACVAATVAIAGDANPPCDDAIRQHATCEAANEYARELLHRSGLTATIVMQDVRTGSLVTFAASNSAKLDVNTSILPLSAVKLVLAASYWDHGLSDPISPEAMSVAEMIVSGDDNAGRRIASTLRKIAGTETVLKDLDRYGFAAKPSAPQAAGAFWSEVPPEWKDRLKLAFSSHSLDDDTSAKEWENTLSLGEERFTVTAFTLSRFLQAVGNDGMMLQPSARRENSNNVAQQLPNGNPARVMQVSTARKLQAAMRAVVERGSAKTAAEVLKATGWQIGGKTGTGPGPNPPGPNSDGCFAGLVFDPQGIARFTVVTFVMHGGLGGGHAARISAEVARFVSAAGLSTEKTNGVNAAFSARVAEIEKRSGGKVGIAAIDANKNKQLRYRGDERFPVCSTFKVLAVAAVLKRIDEGSEQLDRIIGYGPPDLLPNSPVTTAHVKESGMKLGDLCAAAIEQSDNTAGNLILNTIGGPDGLTQFARSLSDSVTRLERTEIELNDASPGDLRDTTTPAAMCNDLQRLLGSDVLKQGSRDQLEAWLQRNVTGSALIRSEVPVDWRVGDKTGRGTTGATNDIAIIRSPSGVLLFLAIYTFSPNRSSDERDKLVAAVTRITFEELERSKTRGAAR